MKKLCTAFIAFLCFNTVAHAQKTAQIKDVLDAEKELDHLIAQKGIRQGFLDMILPNGIIFKPGPVSAQTYYTNSGKIPGKMDFSPKITRISANGDLAFSAGSYSLKDNGSAYPEYGEYLSIWKTDAYDRLKLAFNIEMQHPEPRNTQIVDFKDPSATAKRANKDPFGGKSIIVTTDKIFNTSLNLSTISAYKEFLTLDSRYYFPGFEPIIGQDKILQFVSNQAISIAAENIGAGRSFSSDLAYSYGKATIKKGNITNNYNYIRIWEPDQSHKWNILVEILSSIDK